MAADAFVRATSIKKQPCIAAISLKSMCSPLRTAIAPSWTTRQCHLCTHASCLNFTLYSSDIECFTLVMLRKVDKRSFNFEPCHRGAFGEIRTHTALLLRQSPLPVGVRRQMAGVDGIAPPLRDSESPVPLLYETPNSSVILSPQAGTVKPL